MPADNPTLILQTLDTRLDHAVELTLIGKSALWLGFDNHPTEYGVTQDVDAVVPEQQSDQMNEDLGFWDALTAANAELQEQGITSRTSSKNGRSSCGGTGLRSVSSLRDQD